WEPPPLGTLKCNIGVAFVKEENSFKLVVFIRDDRGQFVMALSHTSPFKLLIHERKALAMLVALQWLKDLEIDDIIIESDCLQVENEVYNCRSDKSKYGVILSNCRIMLRDLQNFWVCFVGRQANSVTHSLDRALNSQVDPHYFRHVP
ncbi:hypothetical protein glysoja_046125, partial [Glycine soja]